MPKTEIAVTVTVIETWFLLIAGDASVPSVAQNVW